MTLSPTAQFIFNPYRCRNPQFKPSHPNTAPRLPIGNQHRILAGLQSPNRGSRQSTALLLLALGAVSVLPTVGFVPMPAGGWCCQRSTSRGSNTGAWLEWVSMQDLDSGSCPVVLDHFCPGQFTHQRLPPGSMAAFEPLAPFLRSFPRSSESSTKALAQTVHTQALRARANARCEPGPVPAWAYGLQPWFRFKAGFDLSAVLQGWS